MSEKAPRVVVVGGVNIDFRARTNAAHIPATSNPGRLNAAPGGVGRNIAENLARLGTQVTLLGAVGNDPFADFVTTVTADVGVDVSHLSRWTGPTGSYLAVLDDAGDLVTGVADMEATDAITPGALDLFARVLNASRPVLAVTPNADGLRALAQLPTDADEAEAVTILHQRGSPECGSGAAGAARPSFASDNPRLWTRSFPAELVDATGAGDAMTAGFVHALARGHWPEQAVRVATATAALNVAVARDGPPRPHRIARPPVPQSGVSMTHPMLKVAPDVADALASARPARGGFGVDHHQPRHALHRQRGHGGGGRTAHSRRGCGPSNHRDPRRPSHGLASPGTPWNSRSATTMSPR